MDMPKDLGKEYKEELAKLEKKQGKDFDGIYVDMMVKDHKKDVSQFKKMSSSLDDPELKGWVDKTLPVLEKHLHAAQQLEKTK
jgi:putative membrane protein